MLKYLGLFLFLIILVNSDPEILLQHISSTKISYLAGAIILNPLLIFIKSVRWNGLLRKQELRSKYGDTFLIYLGSIYLGIITPGRLGELVKALYIKHEHGVTLSTGFSSVALDRLFDLYLLMTLGGVGGHMFHVFKGFSPAVLLVIGFLAVTPLFILHERGTRAVMNTVYRLVLLKKLKGYLGENFDDFYGGVRRIPKTTLVTAGVLTIAAYLLFFSQCYLLARSLAIPIGFVTTAMFIAIASLVSFIPVSVSGLGTRDAVLIYLFLQVGLGAEQAVAFSFLIFFTFFVCGGIIGAVALWLRPLPIKDIFRAPVS